MLGAPGKHPFEKGVIGRVVGYITVALEQRPHLGPAIGISSRWFVEGLVCLAGGA